MLVARSCCLLVGRATFVLSYDPLPVLLSEISYSRAHGSTSTLPVFVHVSTRSSRRMDFLFRDVPCPSQCLSLSLPTHRPNACRSSFGLLLLKLFFVAAVLLSASLRLHETALDLSCALSRKMAGGRGSSVRLSSKPRQYMVCVSRLVCGLDGRSRQGSRGRREGKAMFEREIYRSRSASVLLSVVVHGRRWGGGFEWEIMPPFFSGLQLKRSSFIEHILLALQVNVWVKGERVKCGPGLEREWERAPPPGIPPTTEMLCEDETCDENASPPRMLTTAA